MQVNKIIEHLYTDCKLQAMLVPYGWYKNDWVLRLEKGAVLETINDPPILVRIVEKTVIPINSPIAQCLSLLIYNKPIEDIFNAMCRNWGHDIQRKNVILIIYEKI